MPDIPVGAEDMGGGKKRSQDYRNHTLVHMCIEKSLKKTFKSDDGYPEDWDNSRFFFFFTFCVAYNICIWGKK